jgi:RNA polymerase sigma factor (sigma-70 family)
MAESPTTHLQSLIDRMNAGAAGARNELIGHSAERLRKLARKMLCQDFQRLRRLEDTDDVLNDAVVRLLAALNSVSVVTAADYFRLSARQIRWVLLDLARKHSSAHEFVANPAAGTGGGDSSGTSPAADPGTKTFDPARLSLWTELHKAVESLPEDERDVFELLWYQECTQAEAAAILEISVPTVRHRWLSARLRLSPLVQGLALD